MACGGCGGLGSSAIYGRSVATGLAPKSVPRTNIPRQSKIRSVERVSHLTIKAKDRASMVCPVCSGKLTRELIGNGLRIRKKCIRCNKTFI